MTVLKYERLIVRKIENKKKGVESSYFCTLSVIYGDNTEIVPHIGAAAALSMTF
jgi:hypothetical protein